MAKEKTTRPDAGAVKAMIQQASRIDAQLRQMMDFPQRQRTAAKTAAQKLFDLRLRQALEAMDVEHINNGRQGIRVGLLREAGITNVWQVSRMSRQKICQIDGLGEQSAQKIQAIVQQITENTKQTLRIRIRVEDPGKEEDALIRALYICIHTQPLSQQAEKRYKTHHTPLEQELALARKALSGIGWVFRSAGTKEQINRAVEGLRLRLAGEFGRTEWMAGWKAAEKPALKQCWQDYRSNASAYYAQLESLGLDWNSQDADHGLPAQLAAQIHAQPLDLRYLKGTLRNYQSFGTKCILHRKRSLLGDEMGLGKTVQAIAAMAALAAQGKHHFMVVCPASVLINWCREIPKFSTLEVVKIHGKDEQALQYWRENGGVAVTTYESISRFSLPLRFRFAMLVADEAHYAKNPDTRRTKALLDLLPKAEYALLMSGTPLENRVEEMCFLVSCLQPEIAEGLEDVKFLSTAEQFRQQLAPVYLRRTREDVLQELPELTEKEQWCLLGPQEKQAYRDAVLSGNIMAIRQVSWQVSQTEHSSKASRLLEICQQAKEQKRKVIVFSFFLSTLQKAQSLLQDRCLEPITGAVSPQRRQEIVDAFARAEDGAVLLSQVQAGGTGLNIQSASVIVFCEPQIKPSIENQAISRAYRMGQVRDVLVYRLLAEDTIDERIMELLKTKQLQFDSFAEDSVVAEESMKSGQAWLRQLVEEEKKRVLELSQDQKAGEEDAF